MPKISSQIIEQKDPAGQANVGDNLDGLVVSRNSHIFFVIDHWQ
jgi:hypothetical protein